MIDEAERKGQLKPGGTIVEGTSGNTGMGLALVAAVRGYKIVFTITDKQSREKIDLLKAFGAEVIVCPTAVEPEDPRSYYSVAKKLAREIPNSYYPNQYENPNESRGALPHDPAPKSGKTPKERSRISSAAWGRAARPRAWAASSRNRIPSQDHRRRSARLALLRIFQDAQHRHRAHLRGRRNRRGHPARRRWIFPCSTTWCR